MENNKTSEYQIGYKKPPIEHRFQKGRSGNPSRRPRRTTALDALLEEELSRKIVITDGGRKRTITRLETVIRGLVDSAIFGDRRDRKLLLDVMAMTHRLPPGESGEDAPQLSVELLIEAGERYQREADERAEAIREGRPYEKPTTKPNGEVQPGKKLERRSVNAKSIRKLLQRELSELVEITHAGVRRKILKYQALVKALIAHAASGDGRDRKLLLQAIDIMAKFESTARLDQDLDESRRKFLAELNERCEESRRREEADEVRYRDVIAKYRPEHVWEQRERMGLSGRPK